MIIARRKDVSLPDAAGLQRRLHHTGLRLLDRIGRAHLGAGRILLKFVIAAQHPDLTVMLQPYLS